VQISNEEALQHLTEGTDVKFLSVPSNDIIVVAVEGMRDSDWLCFRIPSSADLPELGTALIQTYVEVLGGNI